MRIADIIAAPIVPSTTHHYLGKVTKLTSPLVPPGATVPNEYALCVLAFLFEHRQERGIERVLKFENLLIDGGIFLDDGRFLAIEIKYRMNWLKACQAGWQFGEFRRKPEAHEYRPVGGIVFFEEFNQDWSERLKRRAQIERGWVNWYEGHATLPGDDTFRIDLVRFKNGALQDRRLAGWT